MKSFFALLLASASVFAAAPNVGLVDPQEIFAKYSKAVELQAELAKSRDAARAAIGEREKALLQLQTELQGIDKRGQDPMLSENGKKAVAAEFQQKNATFQQRLSERQTFINEAQGAIQQRLGEMNKQVVADIRTASEKVAKAKGVQLVLNKGEAFFSDASLDITEDVLKELNAAYKASAPVPAPAAPAPAAPAPAAGDKPAAK
jgi:Skp family chaperone for outer membrane proteins